MTSVQYVGTADSYTITAAQWATAGFTATDSIWDFYNQWSKVNADFTSAQLTYLASIPDMATGMPDGPRQTPHPVGIEWSVTTSAFEALQQAKNLSAAVNPHTILNGSGVPSVSLGSAGDYYMDNTSSRFYGPKTTVWGSGTLLIGAAGSAGAAGKTVLNGAGVPAVGTGSAGDYYIDNTAHSIYGPKTTVWGVATSLIGPGGGTNGVDGKTILSGAVAPVGTVGTQGDFYLNTATSILYGPKGATTWPAGVPLVGPAGANGTNGTNGTNGAAGATGATGPQGPAGSNGELGNPGFETGVLTPHVVHSSATATCSTAAPRNGAYAMRIVAPTKTAMGYVMTMNGALLDITNAKPAKVGDVIHVEMWSRLGTAILGVPVGAAYLDVIDSAGARIRNISGGAVTLTTTYQKLSLDYTIVDANCAFVSGNLGLNTTTSGDVVYIDDMAIDNLTTTRAAVLDYRYKAGPQGIDVSLYGVLPSNNAAANDAAMRLLEADYTAGCKLGFPAPNATYNFSAPFLLTNDRTYVGQGRSTKLSFTNSFIKPPTGTTTYSGLTVRDLSINNGASTSDIISLNNGVGLINVSMENSEFIVTGAGCSIVNAITNVVNLFGWDWQNCLLSRDAASTLPGIRVSSGSVGISAWRFGRVQAHSHAAANVFFYFAYTANPTGGFVNLSWDNIVGEQSANGLINLQGVQGCKLQDISDSDQITYQTSLIRISANASGFASNRCTVQRCGTASSNATFPSGQYAVNITGGVGHVSEQTLRGYLPGTSNVGP